MDVLGPLQDDGQLDWCGGYHVRVRRAINARDGIHGRGGGGRGSGGVRSSLMEDLQDLEVEVVAEGRDCYVGAGAEFPDACVPSAGYVHVAAGAVNANCVTDANAPGDLNAQSARRVGGVVGAGVRVASARSGMAVVAVGAQIDPLEVGAPGVDGYMTSRFCKTSLLEECPKCYCSCPSLLCRYRCSASPKLTVS